MKDKKQILTKDGLFSTNHGRMSENITEYGYEST